MKTTRQRKSDVKLIAASVALIVIAGGIIAAGIYVASTSGDLEECGVFNAGDAAALADAARDNGPSAPLTGGGNCTYVLALDGDDLVAIKPVMTVGGEECQLVWRPRAEIFSCGDAELTIDDVDRYPTAIPESGDLEGQLLVDFRVDPETPLPTG
jgi:hypothetical protein